MSEELEDRLRRLAGTAPPVDVALDRVWRGYRRRRRALVGAAVVAVVAGVGVVTSGGLSLLVPRPSTVAVAPDGSADPADLVGVWRVTQAPGLDGEAWLRVDIGHLELWRECGPVSGPWDANGAAFLATVDGFGEGCLEPTDDATAWMESIRRYQIVGDGVELLDDHGAVLAHLAVGGTPPWEAAASRLADVPTVPDGDHVQLAPRGPIPDRFEPVTPADLVGRWVPEADPEQGYPYAEFSADGRWEATDGCHANSGRWAVDAQGRLLLTEHGEFSYACVDLPEYEPVLRWIQRSGWLAAAADAVIAIDREGNEVGTLVPDTAAREPVTIASVALVAPDRIGVRTHCTRGSTVQSFEETPTEVRVQLAAPAPVDRTGGLICDEYHEIDLQTPLGERKLVDATTGDTVPVGQP